MSRSFRQMQRQRSSFQIKQRIPTFCGKSRSHPAARSNAPSEFQEARTVQHARRTKEASTPGSVPTPQKNGGLLETRRHGLYDRAVRIVVFERPDECAAKASLDARAHIGRLQPHRDRIVVRSEGLRVGVVEPDRDSLIVKVASKPGQSREGEISDDTGGLQVVGGRKGSRARGSLVQAVIGARHARPAARVNGDAKEQFTWRNSGFKVRADGVVDVEVLVADRILLVIEQRRSVIARGLPGAVEVVSLDIVEIELGADRGQLNVGKVLLARRTKHRQQVMFLVGLAEGVELFPEFLDQESRVHGVVGQGKFPIDINAVEDTLGRDSLREMAVDEEVNAARDKGFAPRGGAGGRGKTIGPGKPDQYLQIGMKLLQLLERGKVAV